VELGIVPFGMGAYPGMFRPFNMFRLIKGGEEEDVLFQEGPSGDQLVRDDQEAIDTYDSYFERMIEISLQGGQGEALIMERIDRLGQR
jgi:hypothetical protein